MAQKLSVQIALEGGKEVERQLEGIGEAGQKAFDQIKQSAEVAGGFKNLKMGEVTAQLKEMGVTGVDSINKIKQAVRTGARFETLASGVASVEGEFNKVEQSAKKATAAFGLTRREIGGLRAALRQVDLGPLGGQLMAFGRVGAAFGSTGIAIAAAGAAITGAGVALVKFASAAEDALKALKPLQNASGDSIENLSALANVFERGGTPIKEFAQAFGNLAVEIAGASRTMADDIEQSSRRVEEALLSEAQAASNLENAELNLRKIQLARREARTGRTDPAARQRIKNAEDALKLEQAEQQVESARLALQAARHNVRVAEANDLSTIIQLYQKLGQGAQAAFDPLTTQATKTQALLATLAQAGNKWKSVLADILRNSTELERIQIGKALGLSPEMIATLSRGSAALQEMQRQAQALGIALSAVDQQNLQRLIQSQNEAGALFDAIKQKLGALVAPAIASFWEGFTQRLKELVPVFTEIGTLIGQMDFSRLGAAAADFLVVLAKIAAGWAAMFSGQVSLSDVFARLTQEAGSAAVQLGVLIGQGIIQGILQEIASGIGSIWEAIKSGLSFGGGAPAMPGGGGGFAGGGIISGRGSGTSDSNLAWVSRGEHIMPARAVAQPGMLAFLEALRRSGGNLRHVLDGMGRFALGGLVPRPALAFATGGPVGSMSHVTIQFPGLPPVAGLRASASVVNELHRAAALAQVRSGGRKPSRYS